jgi:dTMP kinase
VFFSFDGIDGAGKSTQMKLFCEWLAERGQRVAACRDPGSTPLGEAVRSLLLDRPDLAITRRAEALLYMAARAQLVEQVIRPALNRGETVVSDRFLLANVVYQGHAGGLDVEQLWQIGEMATGGLEPDLTIVLDLSPEAAARRMNRQLDRMESQGDGFRRGLRDGFRLEASRRPDKILLIDADRPIEVVQSQIRAAAEGIFVKGRGCDAP